MTNFEFYKEELIERGVTNFAVEAKTNGIFKCHMLKCSDCLFSNQGGCGKVLTKWLYEEHKEVPKLTKKERMLCELYETGYIARDYNGDIGWYEKEPEKLSDQRWSNGWGWDNLTYLKCTKHLNFDFITWEDKEPWKVEDLLKLEVIEE